jgi:hypothetical protein
MALLLKLWNAGRALAKIPGALEALLGIAEAARAGDASLVRARSERLATLAAYRASYRL